MNSHFFHSQAVRVPVCPVDQQRHQRAERQLPPALLPVAAPNLFGNNPIKNQDIFLSSTAHLRKHVKALGLEWAPVRFNEGL